jgi:hypothetical protein
VQITDFRGEQDLPAARLPSRSAPAGPIAISSRKRGVVEGEAREADVEVRGQGILALRRADRV